MDLPSLAALSALEAVFRRGSVTAAARELHVSQSAVSHRLRALEDELGVALLSRDGRGVRITAGGARLAHATREALATLQSAVEALSPRREADRLALSISCSPSFAIRFLVPRLAGFRAAHPELDLRIAADDRPVDPRSAAVDASVRLSAGPLPRFVCEKLIDEVVFPVVSPRLLESLAALRTPLDLAAYTLLHDEALADDPRRVSWGSWLAAVGEKRVSAQRGVRFSHAYLAIEAALAGDGVALARRSLVADDLARGRLVAPLQETVPSGLSYWLVMANTSGPSHSPALRALQGFLHDSLRQAQRQADQALLRGRRAREVSASGKPRAPTKRPKSPAKQGRPRVR